VSAEVTHPSAPFAGRVSIVTGAARGIGEAYARALAARGSAVAVVDVDKDAAEQVASGIRDGGGLGAAFAADVARESDVSAMVTDVAAHFGRIDHLVNNAALFGDRTPWDPLTGAIEDWDRAIAVNATSVLLCSRAVVPHMEQNGGGVIVNQASVAAYRATPERMSYGITKMMVIGLTHSLATLLGPRNIRVNALVPGLVDTEGYRRQAALRGSDGAIVAGLPISRIGTPGDLVGGLLYLLSEDASYVTGQCLQIDGGLLMRN
jgi:3-oxoacyl-[acyl-carrier protein] reductase